jgi:hypothetical protein
MPMASRAGRPKKKKAARRISLVSRFETRPGVALRANGDLFMPKTSPVTLGRGDKPHLSPRRRYARDRLVSVGDATGDLDDHE